MYFKQIYSYPKSDERLVSKRFDNTDQPCDADDQYEIEGH